MLAILTSAALLASSALASSTLPGGATVSFGDVLLHEGGAALAPPSSSISETRYFNLAHCACSQPNAAPGFAEATYSFPVFLHPGTTAVHAPLEIWTGAECDNAALRSTQCNRITAATVPDLSMIPATGVTPEVAIFDLMQPEQPPQGCDMRALAAQEWAIADANGDGVYDYFLGQPRVTDAEPPPLPTGFRAIAGPNSIDVSWTPQADVSDIDVYQVLCSTRSGAPASTRMPPTGRYITARLLCNEALDVPLRPLPVDTGMIDPTNDADLDVVIPQEMAELDPTYLCGEQTDPAATSLHIDGLRGGQPVLIEFLAIDRAGNAAAAYFFPYVAPLGASGAGCSCDASQSDPRGALWLAIIVFGVTKRRRRSQRW